MATIVCNVLLLSWQIFGSSILYHRDLEIRWDWDKLDKEISAKKIASDIHKANKEFIFGTSTSHHQVEGDCVNNWSVWEDAGMIKNKDKSG